MIKWKRIASASTMATLLMSTSALADVSPAEVWEGWRDYFTDFGYDISAAETTNGDTLTVSDLTMSMTFPEDEGKATINAGNLLFKDQGDGTVLISMPQQMPIDVVSTVEGEKTEIQLLLDHTGMVMVASGTATDVTYTYSADTYSLDLAKLLVDGQPIDDVDFTLAMNVLQGVSKMTTGDLTKVSQDLTADTLSYQLSAKDSDEGEFSLNANVANMNFSGAATLPENMNTDDPAMLFNSGFAFDGTFTQGLATVVVEGSDDTGPFNAELTSQSSNLEIAVGPQGASYSGKALDVAANIVGGGIPVPVNVEMAEMSYGMKMPLLKGDDQQDVALQMTLGGLTVSDFLWSMIDPGAVLSRDPATLSFDVTGKATLFADLVDEDAANMDAAPAELNSLTLNNLLLEIAGARLMGDGAFTFDNTDLATFDGMPRPNGALNLNLKGANALMDKLVSMGLLPEEQAMAGRMMMGLFAVPAGDDELNSKIEINEEGHVLANGQRIQ